MYILGISAFYHDSATALIKDGEVVAAVQEERFTRIKHDSAFPSNAIEYCLKHEGIEVSDLSAVAFYEKPLLKFERLLETYYAYAPKGIKSFVTAMPSWLNEKLFLKRLIKKGLKELELGDVAKIKLLFPEHHLSHAASAYYPSKFDDAAILTIDGVGEWAVASIAHGRGSNIELLRESRFPHSLGLLYSSFTYFLGFKVNSGEYKLMGLAPYGNSTSAEVQKFVDTIKTSLIDIKDDGSIWLNQKYFKYATGLRMVDEKRWSALFGFPKRDNQTNVEQHHCNLALAIQQVTEEVVLKMAREAKRSTGASNLCLAGGVALNCVANGKIMNEKIFEGIFVQPAAGDAGGALGAAFAAFYIYFEKERLIDEGKRDEMKGGYLGPSHSSIEVKQLHTKYGAQSKKYAQFDELSRKTAELLETGNVIGWMQGRMEFGPRALGNRSILADPRNPEVQSTLNLKIKNRESFRPFAPSVLFEDRQEFFDLKGDSPYMQMVQPVLEKRRTSTIRELEALSMKEKLSQQKTDIPAVTHVDFSARIQTVHQDTNPEYWHLINEFKKITGFGLLVNTSFNVRGEPIVTSPLDAYRCFMTTQMDYLVIGNNLFEKSEQPSWTAEQIEFAAD